MRPSSQKAAKIGKSIRLNLNDIQFDLKLFSFFLCIMIFCFWRIPSKGETGMRGAAQNCLFAHTLPPFMILLPAMLVSYVQGRRPSRLFQRIFLFSGTVLFAVSGTVVLYNVLQDEPGGRFERSVVGALCLVTASSLLVDEMFNDGVCSKCCALKSE